MDVLSGIQVRMASFAASAPLYTLVAAAAASLFVLAVLLNVLNQVLFRNPNEPPVVFHWIPYLGSTISYGMHPYNFFFANREKVMQRS